MDVLNIFQYFKDGYFSQRTRQRDFSVGVLFLVSLPLSIEQWDYELDILSYDG